MECRKQPKSENLRVMAGMAQRKITSFFSSPRAAPASNAVNAVDPQRRSGSSQSDGVVSTTESQPPDRTAGTKEGCADGRGEGGLIQPDCRPGPSDAGNANDSPTASSHEGDSDMSDESESETLTDKRPSKKSSDTVPPSRKYEAKRKVPPSRKYEAKRKRCFLEKWRTDYDFVDYDYQAEMMYCKKCRAMPTLAKGNALFHGVTGDKVRRRTLKIHAKSLTHVRILSLLLQPEGNLVT
ncbi:uncharacterized protein LOC144921480 [Branchiostoma floridae x Branchiostoma belcheri]